MSHPYLSWSLEEVESAEVCLAEARAILRSMGEFGLANLVDRGKRELGRRSGELWIERTRHTQAQLPLIERGAYDIFNA